MKARFIHTITALYLTTMLVWTLVLPCVAIAQAGTTLDEQLMEAADRGGLLLVESLLDKGADINTKGACGWTALTKAAWAGNLDLAILSCWTRERT